MATKHEEAQAAMVMLRDARSCDRPGNEARALELYVAATAGLFAVVRREDDPARKAKWTAQLEQYLGRAEALKAIVRATAPAALAPPQQLAMTRAIEAVFERFCVRGSLGLAEINEMNRVSGDDPLEPAAAAALIAGYACNEGGRLLAPGLVQLFVGMAETDAAGLIELRRILACHGFSESALHELETRPMTPPAPATIKLSDSASDLAVQLGLRGPVEAIQPAVEDDVMEHLEAMGQARQAQEAAVESAEWARVAAEEAEVARVVAAEKARADAALAVAAAEAEAAAAVAAEAEAEAAANMARGQAEAEAERARSEADTAAAAAAAAERSEPAPPPAVEPPQPPAQTFATPPPPEPATTTTADDRASWTVYVKNAVGGETLTVPAAGSDPIGNVKAHIREQTGIPAVLQQLVFAGALLQDSRSLVECNVVDGTTIHLIHRPAASSTPRVTEPEPEPEQQLPPPPAYVVPPATNPGASVPPVSAVEPPRPVPIRALVPPSVSPMSPPVAAAPQPVQLEVVHRLSAERLQAQLRALIAAAPKADSDFVNRLQQGNALLDAVAQALAAERGQLGQQCGDSMASHMLRSQQHMGHVSECVGWVQTAYIDGAPSELAQQRRFINGKAEQLITTGAVAPAAVVDSTPPPAAVAPPAIAQPEPAPDTTVQKMELTVRFFCCGGKEMGLVVTPATQLGRVIETLTTMTGPAPDPAKPDHLVVAGRRLDAADGTVGDCRLEHGQTLYLVGGARDSPAPLPDRWTVDYMPTIAAMPPPVAHGGTVSPPAPAAVSAPPPAVNQTPWQEPSPQQPVPGVPPPVAPGGPPRLSKDPWFEMPTEQAWLEQQQPGLRVSYDVAEAEHSIVERAIAASRNAAVPDPALMALQTELKVAMAAMESRLEQGLLSLPDYAQQLRVKIVNDKRTAVDCKRAGNSPMAMRLLRHTKLMQHELDELQKELPPAPAPAPAPSGPTEFKTEGGRAVHALMNQFNANINKMDRTSAAQQAELEGEMERMWQQEHGAGQRPS